MEQRLYPLAGGEIAGIHFGRVQNPLKLIFLHANGFCAESYRAVLEPLGVHALALDLRGHGRTTLPTEPRALRNWHIFRDDLIAFFDGHVNRPVLLAGHSMGAVSGLLAARQLGERISGYVGLDPVILPSLVSFGARLPGYRAYARRRFGLARKAGQRRDVFESREAAYAHYHGRGAYRQFPDQVLRDFLSGGLREDEGHVRLACDPKWEQAIFVAQGHHTLGAARYLPRHSRILFAGKDAPQTPGSRNAIARLMGPDRVARDTELSHLFPFEKPSVATAFLRDALQEIALSRPSRG